MAFEITVWMETCYSGICACQCPKVRGQNFALIWNSEKIHYKFNLLAWVTLAIDQAFKRRQIYDMLRVWANSKLSGVTFRLVSQICGILVFQAVQNVKVIGMRQNRVLAALIDSALVSSAFVYCLCNATTLRCSRIAPVITARQRHHVFTLYATRQKVNDVLWDRLRLTLFSYRVMSSRWVRQIRQICVATGVYRSCHPAIRRTTAPGSSRPGPSTLQFCDLFFIAECHSHLAATIYCSSSCWRFAEW